MLAKLFSVLMFSYFNQLFYLDRLNKFNINNCWLAKIADKKSLNRRFLEKNFTNQTTTIQAHPPHDFGLLKIQNPFPA